MIARSHRFHGYGGLRGVYRRGQTVRGPLLSLKYERRDPSRPYRMAVVVSRKVHKSAVVRNRIRRRLYELVRNQAGDTLGGYDLVFTVFGDELAETDAQRLEAAVRSLLRKVTRSQPPPLSKPGKRAIVKGKGS